MGVGTRLVRKRDGVEGRVVNEYKVVAYRKLGIIKTLMDIELGDGTQLGGWDRGAVRSTFKGGGFVTEDDRALRPEKGDT